MNQLNGGMPVLRLFFSGLLATALTAGCGDDNPGSQAGSGGDGGAGGDVGGNGGSGGGGGNLACELSLAPAGQVGGACRGPTMAECNGDAVCIQEADAPAFVGGYCTLPFVPTATGCDPAACELECGSCVFVTEVDALCLKNCERDIDSNGACRDGYLCDLSASVCFPGCATDDDCREPDNPNAQATCNGTTYRCEHPGGPGAPEAGAPCEFDEDCEPNGACRTGDFWPGSYCSKFFCDVEGNECAGDGVCAQLVDGFQCLESCTVGSDPVTDPLINTQGCRDGYGCFWDRTDLVEPDGICLGGVFNPSVTTNNIGAPCTSDDECYSPFGYGFCIPDFGCTVQDCGAPGVPDDICGDEAICVDFLQITGDDLLACLLPCTSALDCNPGSACLDPDGLPETTNFCFPLCSENSQCREGIEVCNSNFRCEAP